jgi:SagB-type dehydrogenase family enzyme
MNNRDIEEARKYHETTKHSMHSVRENTHSLDWDNIPSLYKVYRDLQPLSLAKNISPPEMDALRAVGSIESHDDKELDLDQLARVLFFSAGLTNKITLPGGGEHHSRAAACAGALYPNEIYVVTTDIPGLAAGVYHFNARDFALRCLRSGDYRSKLVDSAGDNQGIAGAPVTLVLSAIFWRSAWKYQARSYRYCFWDSGTILANLLAVTAAGEIPSSVEIGFVDAQVDQVLSLEEGKEASLCLVPLGRTLDWTRQVERQDLRRLDFGVEPLSQNEVEYPTLQRMHAACALVAGEEIRPWRGLSLRAPEKRQASNLPLDTPLESSRPLGEVILARGSTRRFSRQSITLKQLSTMLERSTREIPADFLEGPETSLLDIYLIANAVDGLESGAYHYSPIHGSLEKIKGGDFHRDAGHICFDQPLASDAAVVIFFLSDLNRILNRFGNRGYRAAQLEAGIIGGKLYLSAYALRLGATGLTFYDDEVVEFFSPHAKNKDAIFVVALGQSAKTKGQR